MRLCDTPPFSRRELEPQSPVASVSSITAAKHGSEQPPDTRLTPTKHGPSDAHGPCGRLHNGLRIARVS
ncbi:hypothetical protein AK830_g7510 [Neonectria ditissima]|uniref:Uncharacterized protein n=1 Tax=Neonectria ditissima TaxID=78410 RepID=A0A0P7BEQ4_9HYPO|nr:hypothetical protein AK830_g7510 [Neonectria ditissima]